MVYLLDFVNLRCMTVRGVRGGSSSKLKEEQPEKRVPKDDRERARHKRTEIFGLLTENIH